MFHLRDFHPLRFTFPGDSITSAVCNSFLLITVGDDFSHNTEQASAVTFHTCIGLGYSDFARRYFRNHGCFLFQGVLRWFNSPRLLYPAYVFSRE